MANTIIFACLVLPLAYLANFALASDISGLLVLGMGILTWFIPDTAMLVLIALAPISRSPNSQTFGFQELVNTKIILAIIFVLIWLTRIYLGRPRNAFPLWLTSILAMWFSLAAVSLIYAQESSESLQHLAAAGAGISFFFAVWNSQNAQYKKIAGVIAFCAVGVTILSLLQYIALRYRILSPIWNVILAPRERIFMQVDWSPMGDHFYRVAGSFPHSNALGVYYYLVIPFVAAAMTLGELKKWQRNILGVTFLFMLFGLYAANCRAGYIAVFISLAYLSVHRGCRWLVKFGIVCLFIAGLVYLRDPQTTLDYFHTIGRTQHGISSRGSIWENGLDLFHRYTWLGLGPGQFVKHYNDDFGLFIFDNPKEIVEQALFLQSDRENLIVGYHAHNTYLQLMCEYGLLALPLFLFGIVSVLIASEKRALSLPVGSFGRAMALGTASFCTSYLLACFFDSYVAFTSMGLIFISGPLVAMGLRSL